MSFVCLLKSAALKVWRHEQCRKRMTASLATKWYSFEMSFKASEGTLSCVAYFTSLRLINHNYRVFNRKKFYYCGSVWEYFRVIWWKVTEWKKRLVLKLRSLDCTNIYKWDYVWEADVSTHERQIMLTKPHIYHITRVLSFLTPLCIIFGLFREYYFKLYIFLLY
jgi:hypothetical protein